MDNNLSKEYGKTKDSRPFDGMYVDGYRAALQDVLEVLDYIRVDLKLHKRKQNYKTYKAIVECMLANHAILREEPYAFVRCNDNVDGGFEVFIGKHR